MTSKTTETTDFQDENDTYIILEDFKTLSEILLQNLEILEKEVTNISDKISEQQQDEVLEEAKNNLGEKLLELNEINTNFFKLNPSEQNIKKFENQKLKIKSQVTNSKQEYEKFKNLTSNHQR